MTNTESTSPRRSVGQNTGLSRVLDGLLEDTVDHDGLKVGCFNPKQPLSYGTSIKTLWTGPVCVMSTL